MQSAAINLDKLDLTKLIHESLETHLKTHTPKHSFQQVYNYALLPAGKMFRPKLAWASAIDQFNKYQEQEVCNESKNLIANCSLLGSALEMHHTYTLLHDDLPCMDDDAYRRGKLSTHKQFNEWSALLAGDGLLNLSYQLLFKIEHPLIVDYGRYFAWCMGTKGLIHGQCLDLSEESNLSLNSLIHTHRLKTARLIQASVVGGRVIGLPQNCIENSKIKQWKDIKSAHRLGEALGITFQLLDDLSELVIENHFEQDLGELELKINPWLSHKISDVSKITQNYLERIEHNIYGKNLKAVLSEYFGKMYKNIQKDAIESTLRRHNNKNLKDFEQNYLPVMATLDRLRHL